MSELVDNTFLNGDADDFESATTWIIATSIAIQNICERLDKVETWIENQKNPMLN